MPFITQGKTNWKFLLIVIILAIIVGVGALWYSKRPEKPYQLVQIQKKNENYCKQDSDCVFLTFQCCPTPSPCHPEPPEVVNKNSKDKKEEELKTKCILPCPQYMPPICSECLDLETFTPVCVNNKCDIRREINCENYCKAIAKDKSKTCPFISNEKTIITEENTKKCNCETANWKTYRNDKYGFEIKYPTNFYVEEIEPSKSGPEVFIVEFADIQWENKGVHNPAVYIYVINTALSSQEWLNENGTPISVFCGGTEEPCPKKSYLYYGVSDVKQVIINNTPVLQFRNYGASGSNKSTLFKKEPDTLYKIDAHSSGVGVFPQDIYDQMLSTFRFLK